VRTGKRLPAVQRVVLDLQADKADFDMTPRR
jgi:hypothetical protein